MEGFGHSALQFLMFVVGVVTYACLVWGALSLHRLAEQLRRIADKLEKQ